MRKSSNQHPFATTATVMWTLFVTVVHCRQDVGDQFIANILPMDIIVASPTTTTKRSAEQSIDDEMEENEEIAASLNASEVTEVTADRQSSPNVTVFKEDSSQLRFTDDIIAFYDSRRTSRHMDDVPTILLIAISAIAIMLTFSIAVVSALYRRRRKLCISSKTYRPKGSFFAVETESRAWDSLSFSNSIADLSTSKLQFHSLESLSDDSYINSLDEAISYKASIMHKKSLKNNAASPKSTNNTIISQLSISDH